MAPKKTNAGKKYETKTADEDGFSKWSAICSSAPQNPIKPRGKSKERTQESNHSNQALESDIAGRWFACRCGFPKFSKSALTDKQDAKCDFPKDVKATIGSWQGQEEYVYMNCKHHNSASAWRQKTELSPEVARLRRKSLLEVVQKQNQNC